MPDPAMPLAFHALDAPGVQLRPTGPASRWILRGDPPIPVPRTACRALMDGERAALWLGPDEWLLLAPAGTQLDLPPWDAGSLVEVSHRQIGLRVAGPRAVDLLLAGCPLDLAVQPVGFCTRTLLGKAEAILWRDGESHWRVEVWRSFAAYTWALLEEAAATLP